jgi:hypothetical protein
MYKLLKYAICTAEHSLTYDILRKVSPAEAGLLHDPVFKARIRFRFSGSEFPPHIVFKLFIKTDGNGVKYLSGKKTIKPASQAAVDSCELMGNRKFYDQMITDMCQEQRKDTADELNVSNLKDCMKYLAVVDETPASLGGKGNTWRRLSLEVLPRHHIIYDVVSYLEHHEMSPKICEYLNGPSNQSQQLECVNMLIKQKLKSTESVSARRSRKAMKRVSKMRKAYGLERDENSSLDNISPGCIDNIQEEDINLDEDNWDEEGRLLFEWTQGLNSSALASELR